MIREIAVAVQSRRRFILTTAATVGAVAASGLAAPRLARAETAPFTLPPLPYPDTALQPVISSNTLGFHYGKHHQAYLNTLNTLLEKDALKGEPLLDIIKATAVNPSKAALFNNAAQFWNHTFYWNSLRADGGGRPKGRIGELVDKSFGDYDKFKTAFAATCIGQFGSGWGWLCLEGDKLVLKRTGNADTPVYVQGVKPLLTIDVWEHAYYLDYQNRRADYVNAVIDKLLNWEFAEKNLG
jgi:superoxide dismutase, Fe-Mn family